MGKRRGVAPDPTRGAAPGLRKGQLPLDPFFGALLERVSRYWGKSGF